MVTGPLLWVTKGFRAVRLWFWELLVGVRVKKMSKIEILRLKLDQKM